MLFQLYKAILALNLLYLQKYNYTLNKLHKDT